MQESKETFDETHYVQQSQVYINNEMFNVVDLSPMELKTNKL